MAYETLALEQDGAIAVLTLNRPKCLNAINHVMRDELRSFLQERLLDLDTRVIVITGAGKGFCAGLDIRDQTLLNPGTPFSPKKAYEVQRGFSELVYLMRRCPQPIVGAINGVAVGGGFSMAMACDVRLAAPSTRFQAAYINLGLGGADMGGSWLLPRAIGTGNAARYLLTGDFMPADEALRIGFVQAVVEPDGLLGEAMKIARTMASKSPLGLRLTKEALDQNASGVTLEEAIRLEDRNQAMCIAQLTSGQR